MKTQRLHPEGGVVVRNADIADIADVFCGADSKTGAPDTTPGAANWVDELEKLEAVSRAVSDSVAPVSDSVGDDKVPGPATCSGCKHLSDTAFCSVTRGHRYARQARCDKYER